MERISELAKRIGLPEQSHDRLREALTHRTYAVEHSVSYDNQRLEFLGDAVLEIIHTDYREVFESEFATEKKASDIVR